jgi:ATP-dependent Lhr-like helicase
MLAGVRAVIVDEIHAVAGTKRGAHLALAMERLADLCVRAGNRPPQRIGLSATQRPLEEVARFLGGCEKSREEGGGTEGGSAVLPQSLLPPPCSFRPVTVVDCGLVKEMEIAVASPVEDLGDVGGSVWPAVAALVLQHIRRARTTLVFVNNRAQAERIAARVNALASGGDVGGASAYAHGGGGERVEVAQPYHGSLSRERRLMLEERLKAGELKALVATSSLELGIDIGSVDLVLQLQSPKRVSAALQRVGRSGHALGAASRGVLVPTFRDDAAEILAVVDAMRAGDVEPTRVVQNALDVLAQTVVAMVAVDDWTADELYDFVRRAYPYAALPRPAFDGVLAMLAGKYPSEMAAELQARLSWDGATGQLAPLPGSRLTSPTAGSTW